MTQKQSLWDLAVKDSLQVDLSNTGEKTLIFVGNKGVGKSTIIQRFLDRNEVVKETLALEYNFGRKSGRSLKKETCHVWELGGETLHINLLDLHLTKKDTTIILVLDLSTPETLWKVMESFLTYIYNYHKKGEKQDLVANIDNPTQENVIPFPMPLVIVGGMYDVFQKFSAEKRRTICQTLRAVAHSLCASLIFHSDKDAALIKKLKDALHYHGFGGSKWKGHCSDHNKPLLICAGNDTYEEIGICKNSLNGNIRGLSIDYFKHTYTTIFPQVAENRNVPDDPAKDQNFREPLIDSLRAQKDDELDRFLADHGQKRNFTLNIL